MQKRKMNGLFKTGFILLMVCIAMLIAAIIVAYLFESPYFSAVFSAGGAFLALLGIIFVMLSKPKKEKPEQNTENLQEENFVDNSDLI
ncbi:hypothetical protein [Ruminococcus sp.]|uniref:hypothetical protein n=1 Tax=Ruminococcus sp. TaxID=41978 RepID=UPI003EFC5A8F